MCRGPMVRVHPHLIRGPCVHIAESVSGTVVTSLRAVNVGWCIANTIPTLQCCRYSYDAQHMYTCNVPQVVSHVVLDMRSTLIRHRFDIDHVSSHFSFE